MKLQELLDNTNLVFSTIGIHHRNTLNSNYNLHAILGDIKDFFYDFIDEIGEDIVITGGKAEFDVVSVDKIENRKDIYMDSVEKIKEYLTDLENFYNTTDNEEIQNEYMAKSKELRKMYNKLMSVCEEMGEKEEKVLPKKKVYLGIKKNNE